MSTVTGKLYSQSNSSLLFRCSSTCLIERGWTCTGGSPTKIDICTQKCGDGAVFPPRPSLDYCDDGNNVEGDGCSSKCQVEKYYTCSGGTPTTKDKCIEICGDGVDLGTYPCDDGNLINGDGCNSQCQVEFGYVCSGGSLTQPDTCKDKCTDGYVVRRDVPNYCDDGNTVNGDGCSKTCSTEPGFQCAGGSLTSADSCWEICGDGKNYGFVQCDDGNKIDGDGCSADCKIETLWQCFGGSPTTPDTCQDICGDGYVVYRDNNPNYCDDGNNINSDGCNTKCEVEFGFSCGGGTES